MPTNEEVAALFAELKASMARRAKLPRCQTCWKRHDPKDPHARPS